MASGALVFGTAVSPDPAAAGGGGCHEASEGAGTVVEMVDVCFTPTILRVDEGTTITFVNRDPMMHVVLGIGWGSADLQPGAETTQLFDTAGTYVYSCYLHPSMNGAVVVGDGVGSGPVVAASVPTSTSTTQLEVEPASSSSNSPAPVLAGVGIVGLGVGFAAARLAGRRPRAERAANP